jgi:hypothetical protein
MSKSNQRKRRHILENSNVRTERVCVCVCVYVCVCARARARASFG